MKKLILITALSLAVAGLSACTTIDEERYAGVACDDIKQLMSAQNMATLSQDGGYYGAEESYRREREDRDLFDRLDSDQKNAVELRAAYRNNCK